MRRLREKVRKWKKSAENSKGDITVVEIGEGGRNIAAGKNIIQIGSVKVPVWLVALLVIGMSLSVLLSIYEFWGSFGGWWHNRQIGQMIQIPAGNFIMGHDGDVEFDYYPERSVYLDNFWIDTFEVTNREYYQFHIEREHSPPSHWLEGKYPDGREDHPVVGVSWYDADQYCKYVGKRLPTEAEWEKAARGIDGRIWPWGNAWELSRANTAEEALNDTVPVGSFDQGNSFYGVADMAGNVWEWVNDWYGKNYYSASPRRNPSGPVASSSNPTKVVRGASWIENKEMAATYFRLGIYPPSYPPEVPEKITSPISYIGFRCACDSCR